MAAQQKIHRGVACVGGWVGGSNVKGRGKAGGRKRNGVARKGVSEAAMEKVRKVRNVG